MLWAHFETTDINGKLPRHLHLYLTAEQGRTSEKGERERKSFIKSRFHGCCGTVVYLDVVRGTCICSNRLVFFRSLSAADVCMAHRCCWEGGGGRGGERGSGDSEPLPLLLIVGFTHGFSVWSISVSLPLLPLSSGNTHFPPPSPSPPPSLSPSPLSSPSPTLHVAPFVFFCLFSSNMQYVFVCVCVCE